MIKKLLENVAVAAAVVIGMSLGQDLYDTAKNPVKRAEIKKKLATIRDNIIK